MLNQDGVNIAFFSGVIVGAALMTVLKLLRDLVDEIKEFRKENKEWKQKLKEGEQDIKERND